MSLKNYTLSYLKGICVTLIVTKKFTKLKGLGEIFVI